MQKVTQIAGKIGHTETTNVILPKAYNKRIIQHKKKCLNHLVVPEINLIKTTLQLFNKKHKGLLTLYLLVTYNIAIISLLT